MRELDARVLTALAGLPAGQTRERALVDVKQATLEAAGALIRLGDRAAVRHLKH